jgi:acyl-coenzyme A thioesterase PaaI-like protein
LKARPRPAAAGLRYGTIHDSTLTFSRFTLQCFIVSTLQRFNDPRSHTMTEPSLQEHYAPNNACFGCGPANPDGLHIRSFARGDEVVAEWQPEQKYEAFPGVLNGGIIGSLLDCHCNWTAAYHLMKQAGEDRVPCTVTADYAIKLLRPTPTNGPVQLSAKVAESSGNRATIEGTLSAGGKVCATCRGTFVAVKEGHPAFHRW